MSQLTSDLLQPQVGLSQGSTSYVSPDARDLRIGLWIAGVAEAAEAGTLENPRVTDIPKEKEKKIGIKNILKHIFKGKESSLFREASELEVIQGEGSVHPGYELSRSLTRMEAGTKITDTTITTEFGVFKRI